MKAAGRSGRALRSSQSPGWTASDRGRFVPTQQPAGNVAADRALHGFSGHGRLRAPPPGAASSTNLGLAGTADHGVGAARLESPDPGAAARHRIRQPASTACSSPNGQGLEEVAAGQVAAQPPQRQVRREWASTCCSSQRNVRTDRLFQRFQSQSAASNKPRQPAGAQVRRCSYAPDAAVGHRQREAPLGAGDAGVDQLAKLSTRFICGGSTSATCDSGLRLVLRKSSRRRSRRARTGWPITERAAAGRRRRRTRPAGCPVGRGQRDADIAVVHASAGSLRVISPAAGAISPASGASVRTPAPRSGRSGPPRPSRPRAAHSNRKRSKARSTPTTQRWWGLVNPRPRHQRVNQAA